MLIVDAIKMTLSFCLGCLMIQSGIQVGSMYFFAIPGLALVFYVLGSMFNQKQAA